MKTGLKFFILLAVAAFLTLGCEFVGNPPSAANPLETEETEPKPVAPSAIPQQTNPASKSAEAGFIPADCEVNGVNFVNITTDINDFGPYNGPHLICNTVTTGDSGLNEMVHFEITTQKPEFITASYEDQKATFKTIVDEAIAWKEKNPTAGIDTAMIREDNSGYIYMVFTNASVQGCLLGEGYGVEIIDQYLVNYMFSSCEGDALSYMTSMENLRSSAAKAIERVQQVNNP